MGLPPRVLRLRRGAQLASLIALSCSSSPVISPPPSSPAEPAGTAELNVPNAGYADVLLEGAPHVRQKPDFCGEACVEMALRRLGRPLSQDEVFNRSGVDPALGRGVYTPELKTALERTGFAPGQVMFQVEAARAAEGLAAQFAALHADLRAGIPSIVCMHYSDRPETTEHFRLILGYDAKRDEVVYNEPAEDNGAYRRMPRSQFLNLWPLKYRADNWTVIRFRLDPTGPVAKPPEQTGFSNASFAQHIMALRKKIGPGFTVLVERPFVVIGDGDAATVRRQSEGTVRWATAHLKRSYFQKDPGEILDVFLFKDERSYKRNTLAFFNDTPTTPYGYYTSSHRALLMNIATGGGTLVHEIVHPFMEANFPSCPPWFNEGLGSLYEQSGEEGGQIHGYPNWRLAGLKRAIRGGRVPSFQKLTAASEHAFYNEDSGTNYAQSRYLLYYLQEKGLLVRYYREFFEHKKADPTGYETLKSVLGEGDMDAFKARWEGFVMGLSFP